MARDSVLWAAFRGTVSAGTLTQTKAYGCTVARTAGGKYTLTFDKKIAESQATINIVPSAATTGNLSVIYTAWAASGATVAFEFDAGATGTATDPTGFSVEVRRLP